MTRKPAPRFRRLLRRAALLATGAFVAFIALRIWQSEQGPPLAPWHQFVPQEIARDALEGTDWAGYMAAEATILATVRTEVTNRLAPEDRVAANRYFAESPVNPMRFAQDWNRSFILEPDGPPRGAAVLLHGLTDAPFSMRHLAQLYRDLGFVAIAIRMPGHGTVPAGLAEAVWEDWMAATRLAVREARRRVGPDRPLHLVGYSNGGALAVKHALDAIEDPHLARPDRIVLLSPMIGVTAFARFAGLAGLPAMLPRFARAAWLDVQPEYNPFKYNSFPVNAARQTYRLTAALQAQLGRLAAAGRLDGLAPILTFQSAADATVSTPAVVSALYAHLPENGSELVLFDLNRRAAFGPLFGPAARLLLDRIVPPAPRRFGLTIVADAPEGAVVEARRSFAGSAETGRQPLGLAWPRGVFSLSHVALPFPPADGLYGADPDPADAFGVQLGAIDLRGERGVLIVGLDALSRATSNPFFAYIAARVTEALPPLRR